MKYKGVGSFILAFAILFSPISSYAETLNPQIPIENQPVSTTTDSAIKVTMPEDYIGTIRIANGLGQIYDFDATKVFKFLPNPSGGVMLLQMDEVIFYQELENMKKALNKKGQNAATSINTKGELVAITLGVQAIEMDIEKAKQDLIMKVRHQDFTPYQPVFNYGQVPSRTTEDMKKINFILSEFSTSFNSKVAGRSENISLAAKAIDGTILMPGEEFSFNKVVGQTTLARGYKNAPVIVDGEFVEGVGGGVCQVSTTLFNSVLRAGMTVTSRRNHSLPVAYVPKGTDAAVASTLDFKFKNTLNNPIYLQAFVENSKIYFRIYGSQADDKEVNISVKKLAERKYEMTRTVNGSIQDKFISNYREPKKTN